MSQRQTSRKRRTGSRLLVYTGKGGVGKTTIAAATAVICAERGYRTLVVSTDIAHSLGDALERRLGPEPIRLAPNLWGQETDVHHTIRRYWGTIQAYVASVFQWRGLDAVVAEEMAILPGLDELASLLCVVDEHDSDKYDVIILDAAPTGETLRLLSLPDAARWWLDRIMPISRRATQLAGPVLRRVIGMPIPEDAVFKAGEELLRKVESMHELLTDHERSSLRIVLNLERMVIHEARRSFTYFHLFGYPTDLVICNRVLSNQTGPFFAAWRDSQRRYSAQVEEAFAPVPVRTVPFFDREIAGVSMLREVGNGLYGRDDPLSFFYRGRPFRVERENGSLALSMSLPFVRKDEVEITREDDELGVQIGPWRRNLVLPQSLVAARIKDARLEAGELRIQFQPTSAESAKRKKRGGR